MDKRIGAQLYTCRDYCKTAEDLDATIKRVNDIGYKTVQISGIGAEITGEEVGKSAKKYGVEVVCTHRSFPEFTDDLDGLIKFHKDMNCKIAGIGSMPSGTVDSKENLFAFIEKANEIAKKLKKEGITFGYHNHSIEFKKLDGKYILDTLLENTDENFKLILDVYWVAHAGINPIDIMEKYADRIAVLHYKDKKVTQWAETCICEVGEGNLNWDAIIEATERLGIEWAMVEQDNSWFDNDPFKSLEMSYKYLTKKGFI